MYVYQSVSESNVRGTGKAVEMISSEQWRRQDAGTTLSDEQMRSKILRYPIDRYLVECSKTIGMINITDEICNPEPALRPEDDIMLKNLQEMLQSTADDLKLISGELLKYREPKVQFKMPPTPLDEEFNEKVHIEEIVNAKFHGYKVVDPNTFKDNRKSILSDKAKPKTFNAGVQVTQDINCKKINAKIKKLSTSQTKVIQIHEKPESNLEYNKLDTVKVMNDTIPSVSYNEYTHKYVAPKIKTLSHKQLQTQVMPSINIRSEFKEQKVLHLDIIPEQKGNNQSPIVKSNVSVITVCHDTTPVSKQESSKINPEIQKALLHHGLDKVPVRKISKIETCESSESTNNISSDTQCRIKTQNLVKTVIRSSPKMSSRFDTRRNMRNDVGTTRSDQRQHLNVNDWRKKLNTIYSRPSTSRKSKTHSKPLVNNKKDSFKKSSTSQCSQFNKTKCVLNNVDYIPYSKLTLGGVQVSDVEREISDLPDKNNIPLSPILDRILTSRENSFHNSPKKMRNETQNVLNTSDENLLQEILDIEINVNKTLPKKDVKNKTTTEFETMSDNNGSVDYRDSYAEDFEDVHSESDKSQSNQNESTNYRGESHDFPSKNSLEENINLDAQNTTYIKSTNLSFKNSVDIFEFIHSVDTQDSATQSNSTHKISLKATQTSPRTKIQPIHNNLWPSASTADEVSTSLKEDFIKKLIIDECKDIFQKNFTTPSTSKDTHLDEQKKNLIAMQKNTQTSPAHAKSVMTSPTRTKTRTTSPIELPRTDHGTSPMTLVSDAEELKLELNKIDDLSISINLSSPRFNLRLPQSTRDIATNIETSKSRINRLQHNQSKPFKTYRKNLTSSSSSANADYSSSDISFGEIKHKLKRKLRKNKILLLSESTASSTASNYNSSVSSLVPPLRSEGELSLGQVDKRKSRFSKSDGEVSLGPKC